MGKEYTLLRQFYAWIGFTAIIAGIAYGTLQLLPL